MPPPEPSSPPSSPPRSPPLGPPGSSVLGPPTTPPRSQLFPEQGKKKRRFGLELGADFSKTFEASIVDEETVAFGSLEDLSDPGSANPGGVTAIDTDVEPVITDVTGDPTADELDDLLGRDTDLSL